MRPIQDEKVSNMRAFNLIITLILWREWRRGFIKLRTYMNRVSGAIIEQVRTREEGEFKFWSFCDNVILNVL